VSVTFLLTLLLLAETPSKTSVGEPFFFDSNQGWVVVSSCVGGHDEASCRNALWKTRDGGRHWREFSEVPDSGGIPLEGVFIDATRAVLYGTGPLVFTDDGGLTFAVKATAHWNADIAREGNTLWAVGAVDREDALAGFGDRVLACDLEGNRWRTLDLPLPRGQVLALVPFSDRDALVLYAYNTLEGMPVRRLKVTGDGGNRWSEIDLPCENAEGLIARDRSHLWLTCGSDDMPRPDPDHLFTSRDGGRTWKGPVDVPSSGRQYALGRGDRVWAAGGCRFVPFAFDAAGKVFEFRIRNGMEAGGGDCFGRVQFVGPDHGWISFGGSVHRKGGLAAGQPGKEGAWLFRTVDGGNVWEPNLIALD